MVIVVLWWAVDLTGARIPLHSDFDQRMVGVALRTAISVYWSIWISEDQYVGICDTWILHIRQSIYLMPRSRLLPTFSNEQASVLLGVEV